MEVISKVPQYSVSNKLKMMWCSLCSNEHPEQVVHIDIKVRVNGTKTLFNKMMKDEVIIHTKRTEDRTWWLCPNCFKQEFPGATVPPISEWKDKPKINFKGRKSNN